MDFVARAVKNGTEETLLGLFGILKACQMWNIEKLLGKQEIGMHLGIVYNVGENTGIVQKRRLCITSDLPSDNATKSFS